MNRAAVILVAILSSGGALERPCNRICRYSPTFGDGQICIGCFLTVDETRTWASMDATQRGWAEEVRAGQRGSVGFDGIRPNGLISLSALPPDTLYNVALQGMVKFPLGLS